MSYARGMGDTASDIARVAAAAAGAAATLIGAATGTTPGTAATTIDPATGLPYGTVNPATGLPYGTPAAVPESDYTVPLVIGGLVLVGIGGYFLMRKRSTPNRRRVRRNTHRQVWVWDWVGGGYNSGLASSKAEATKIARAMGRPSKFKGGMTVTLVPKNVRLARPGELASLDRGWD